MSTPSDFLDSANTISNIPNQTSDAISRAAINRGYYAIYHTALEVKERLLLPDAPIQIKGSHERLFQSLCACTPAHSNEYRAVQSLGLMAMRTLKPYRHAADYKIDEPLPIQAEEQTLTRAKTLLKNSACIKPKAIKA